MLRGGIVPDCDIARTPAPAHSVFEPGHVGLQHLEQMVRVRLRIADESPDEMPKHEGALTSAKDAHDRMFGLVDRGRYDLFVVLDGCRRCLRLCAGIIL